MLSSAGDPATRASNVAPVADRHPAGGDHQRRCSRTCSSQLSARGERCRAFDLLFLLAGLTYAREPASTSPCSACCAGRPALQAYVQFAGDLLLVTGLVYFFGGIASPFSMLYLSSSRSPSVLLRRRAGMIVADVAYLLYAGARPRALLRVDLPPRARRCRGAELVWRLAYNLAIHLFGFYAVALLTSYLARERRARRGRSSRRRRGSLADLEVVHRDVIQSISQRPHHHRPRRHRDQVNRAALEILGATRGASWSAGRSRDSACFARRELGAARPRAERAPAAAPRAEIERRARRRAAAADRLHALALTDAQGSHRRLHRRLPGPDALARAAGGAADQGPHGGGGRARGRPRARDRQPAGRDLGLGAAPLRSRGRRRPAQRKLLEIVLKESQRLDRTIKGFLRFARPRERATRALRHRRACSPRTSRCCATAEEAAGRHRLELDLDPPSADPVGDPDQVSQIFWNLARNALRAMPDGGTLRVSGRLARRAATASRSSTPAAA